MPNFYEGHFVATGRRFAIIASRWNAFLADKLVEGAIDTLVRHGASPDAIDVYKVPGSFELPLVAKRIASIERHHAIVCIGMLIRGATPHFDHIAAEATKGIAAVGMEAGIPVTYGVVTADSLEQAIERSGTKAGNKGSEAALAAIEMADLYARLQNHG